MGQRRLGVVGLVVLVHQPLGSGFVGRPDAGFEVEVAVAEFDRTVPRHVFEVDQRDSTPEAVEQVGGVVARGGRPPYVEFEVEVGLSGEEFERGVAVHRGELVVVVVIAQFDVAVAQPAVEFLEPASGVGDGLPAGERGPVEVRHHDPVAVESAVGLGGGVEVVFEGVDADVSACGVKADVVEHVPDRLGFVVAETGELHALEVGLAHAGEQVGERIVEVPEGVKLYRGSHTPATSDGPKSIGTTGEPDGLGRSPSAVGARGTSY